MTCHLLISLLFETIIQYTMNSSQLSESTNSKRQKMSQKRQKAKEKFEHREQEKPLTKQQIRKEKNRLAAQKSRDRKQEYVEQIEKENQQLKTIISVCDRCSQAHQQMLYSQENQEEEMQEDGLLLNEHSSNEEPILVSSSPHPTFSPPSFFLRHEEDSNSSHISKYFWFTIFIAVICIAHYGGGSQHVERPQRMTFQVNNNNNFENYSNADLHSQGQGNSQASSTKKGHWAGNNKGENQVFSQKTRDKFENRLMNYSVKQCAKCMECFRNMTSTNSTSLSPVSQANNLTAPKNATNTTNKILFCKSRALFFKKIYRALEKIESSTKRTSEVAKVQASGKMLSEFMDRQCFSDSQIDQNQLYNLEFTVAIMELTPVKEKSKNLTQHFRVNQ